MDDEKTLREKVRRGVRRYDRGGSINSEDMVSAIVAELLPPKETVTWMVGDQVRLCWPERRVVTSVIGAGGDAVDRVVNSVELARAKGYDLLILDLRPERP